jgi:hypothetical protein
MHASILKIHFRFMTSGDVISGNATFGDSTSGRTCAHDHFRHHHTAPPQILSGWCFYTNICFSYFRCWSVLTPYDPFYLGNIFWMMTRHSLK